MVELKPKTPDKAAPRTPKGVPPDVIGYTDPGASAVASATGLHAIAGSHDGPRAALQRLDPGARRRILISVQRLHGNAAAQRLINRPPRPVQTVDTPDGLADRDTQTDPEERPTAEKKTDSFKPVPSNPDVPLVPPSAPDTNGKATGANDGQTPADAGAPGPGGSPSMSGDDGARPGAADRGGGADGEGRARVGGPDVGAAAAQEGPGAEAYADEVSAAGSLDTASAEALLASLAHVPASALGQMLRAAKALAPGIQGAEKAAAQAAIAAIDQPTGLPAVAAPKAVPDSQLKTDQPKEPPVAAGRATTPQEPRGPEMNGPLLASQAPAPTTEPPSDQESSGSWWSWLTGFMQKFFGSLRTTDPNVSTSAGARERVDLSGDANPNQNTARQQASEDEVAGHRTTADAATTGDFGEKDVRPTIPVGKLRPSYKPSAPPALVPSAALGDFELSGKQRGAFDRATAPWVDDQVQAQLGTYRQDRTAYEAATAEAQQAGKRQIDEETDRTRAEQEKLRTQVRADVDGERQRWREENRKIQEEVGSKASARRQEIDRQIQDKVATSHRDVDAKLDEAETQAQTAKTKAETDAAEKKRAEESKPRSWWDRVKGAVSSVFDAIRSAVNAIFDKLRQVVNGIIEIARKAVHALIEAARAAIVGLIQAFGEFVKGLVSIALAAFPEAAAKARSWIDGKVKDATDAVNRAADTLHRAADAALDFVAKAIDTALGILQASFNKALDVLEKLTLLPFQAAEALAKLVAWIRKNGAFLQAATNLEGLADKVIEGLKTAIAGMVAEVPAKAYGKLKEFAGQLGDVDVAEPAAATAGPAAAPAASTGSVGTIQRQVVTTSAAPVKRSVPASVHVQGILRHLGKGLAHLKDHWWDELKKVGWNLLWPWPAVWADLKEIWKEIKAGFDAAYHLRVGKVIDHILTIEQKFNSILGNLYGWFFIASVLIGAILGGIFGVGAGAIPGALAGAAFAGTVGEALVAALIATESAVIVKSVADLAIGNDKQEEDEEDYGKIGGSTLTIAITLAMLLLGEIAAKLAKSIWEGVAGLVRGEKAPEVKVEVKVEGEGTGGKGADVPEGKTGGEDVLPPEAAEKGVSAERTTADGHKVKVLEDGRIFLCTTCEELRFKFDEEIKASEDFQKKLADAEATADPQAKAEKAEALEKELAEARQQRLGGEDLTTKISRLDEISRRAEQALGRLKEAIREKVGRLQRTNGQLRGEIEAEIRRLDGELERAKGDIDTAKDLGDAGEIDALREKLDDVRAQSEQLEKRLNDAVPDEPQTVPDDESGGGPEVDRSLRVKAERPEARLIENPAERFPRSQAMAIDEVQTVMNDLYREGAAFGDGSTAYITMLEQARGGVGHDPVSVVGDTLHAQKAQQYAQGLAEHPQLPNLPPEAQGRVQLEISKMNEALEWARAFRAGEDPPVPGWAKEWADELVGR